MNFNLVVAVSENGVIGNKGKTPWHLPKDLKFFKNLTLHHAVIMGRNTLEAIGKPLPQRKNIVLSRSLSPRPDLLIARSWDEIPTLIKPDETVFVIGGQQIFEQALERNLVRTLYRTLIHHTFEGDAFFHFTPQSPTWQLLQQELWPSDAQNPYNMTLQIWEKL